MEQDSGVDAVLDVLHAQRGLDFRHYRRSTIERRLSHRLVALRVADYPAYLEILSHDPAELDRLVGQLTLKVTGFFRNPAVFDLLGRSVLSGLLARGAPIGIWSAGCASGEEAYSVAMLVEGLGHRGNTPVTIVGTDIDEQILRAAEAGRYGDHTPKEVPAPLLDRWFEVVTEGRRTVHVLHPTLRQRVRYIRHNLVDSDGPPEGGPAEYDLILCRNVLIYFQRPLQERVVNLLHRSLTTGGFLVLGEAESLPLTMEPQYHCLDRRARVYRKVT